MTSGKFSTDYFAFLTQKKFSTEKFPRDSFARKCFTSNSDYSAGLQQNAAKCSGNKPEIICSLEKNQFTRRGKNKTHKSLTAKFSSGIKRVSRRLRSLRPTRGSANGW